MKTANRKINKIHFYSGLTLILFIGLHLINHLISIYGVEAHIELMNKFRVVYRNPIIELFLMIVVISQIITGTKLFFTTRKKVNNFYKKLQIWTGLYLAIFLLIHVSAVMLGRYLFNVDTNIYFGAAGLNIFPFYLFFIPYYSLAIISFFGHLSAIHFEKMKKNLIGLSVKQQSNLILLLGILVTFMVLYGLTNGFTGLTIPDEYYNLFKKI